MIKRSNEKQSTQGQLNEMIDCHTANTREIELLKEEKIRLENKNSELNAKLREKQQENDKQSQLFLNSKEEIEEIKREMEREKLKMEREIKANFDKTNAEFNKEKQKLTGKIVNFPMKS